MRGKNPDILSYMNTWTTNDGRSVDMAEMSNEHLANAAAMVKRRLIREACRFDTLDVERARRERRPRPFDAALVDLDSATDEYLEQERAAAAEHMAAVIARESKVIAETSAEIEHRAISKAWRVVGVGSDGVGGDLARWRHTSGRTLLASIDGQHVYWMRDARGRFLYRSPVKVHGAVSVSVAAAIIVDAAVFGLTR